jgi:amino acid adenylation domain-containing protein
MVQKPNRAFNATAMAMASTGHPFTFHVGEFSITIGATAHRSTAYDLALVAADAGELICVGLEYAKACFAADDIDRFATHLLTVLDAALESPGLPMHAHEMLTPGELDILRSMSAGPTVEHPEQTIVDMVRTAIGVFSERVAVVDRAGSTTYRELGERIDRFASRLAAAGLRPGQVAGIMMERSTDMVVAVLSVLEAGAAFVPLDPGYPQERIDFMLGDAGAAMLITDLATQDKAPVGHTTLVFDAEPGEAARSRLVASSADASAPSDLAYIIYTSGSTGRPKGVAVEHRNVTNFLRAMAVRPGIVEDDVILAITTLSFDPSVLEILLPLATGARFVLVDRSTTMDPERLSRAVVESGATIVQATPTTGRMLIEHGWQGGPTLKLLCGGEALSPDLSRALRSRCASLWNVYGPTETTVWSTAHRVEDADVPVPVGTPIDNMFMYVRCTSAALV